MKIQGTHYHSIWEDDEDPSITKVIDQRHLPHDLVIEDLDSVEDYFIAIQDMHVRGAPLIGICAAYGMCAADRESSGSHYQEDMARFANLLKSARPTAVDLEWAVDRQMNLVRALPAKSSLELMTEARTIKEESLKACRKIGEYGLDIIRKIYRVQQKTVNILTHCNAGWLACADFGTATAPIYAAFDSGIPVHVWVDETRPRNQGASLTAFELKEHGIPHTLIVDNAGGHLMQKGQVDLVITGTDRTTRSGDVCNKIGTYQKALAAKDNNIPFYVAAPRSSIDLSLRNGLEEIIIEKRNPREVKYMKGKYGADLVEILIAPEETQAVNYAFDVTPARLVTGLITEMGICEASEKGILGILSGEC